MDDMGSSHAANAAGIELLNKGIVTSCSVMIPCAYAYDFIRWWKRNRQIDVGIHLTLTCEWDNAKWRPMGVYEETSGLWSDEGFMWQSNDDVIQNATPREVYCELDAQIKSALNWGLEPSHLDRHMHTVTLSEGFFNVYMELSKKYGINYQITKDELIPGAPVNNKSIDRLIGVGDKPGLNLQQKLDCLKKTIQNLKPGITQLTIHPVTDMPEIRYIIPDWYERFCEYQMFMENEILEVIKENNIELISYEALKINRTDVGVF